MKTDTYISNFHVIEEKPHEMLFNRNLGQLLSTQH